MAPLPVTTGLGGNFVRCFVNKVMMSKLVRTPSIFLCVVKAESGCQRGHFLFRIAQVSINLYTCNHTMIRFYNRGKIYTFITLCFFFQGVLGRIEDSSVCPLPITLPAIAQTPQSKMQ